METQIEEIKRKTDIVEIVSGFVELKKAGKNLIGLCPFHSEKTPSFNVSPQLQIYKCFGCQAAGDVYSFLMDFEKIDFPQALKILADAAGVKLKPFKGSGTFQEKEEIIKVNSQAEELYHYILTKHPLGRPALYYLTKRGVDEASIETFKLGFAPQGNRLTNYLTKKKGYNIKLLEKAGLAVKRNGQYIDLFRERIIFPLNDHYGQTLGFAGRIIKDADTAKYINTPETLTYKKGRMLFGLDIAKTEIKNKGFTLVVEGELDSISCFQKGIKNVVAIKGSALTDEQSELLSRFCSKVYLALDSDFAGLEAARRGIEIAQKHGLEVKIVELGQFKDPDEAAQKDPDYLKKQIEQAESVYDFLINSTLKRFNIQETEGKAQASKFLSPIIAQIEDEIVKADCVKKVAQRLGVPEEAVALQAQKFQTTPRTSKVEGEGETRPRRALLEERLISLVLETKPEDLQRQDIVLLIKTPAAKRFIQEVKKDPKIENIAKNLPEELMGFLANVVMTQELYDSDPDWIKKEAEETKRQLQIIDTKEEIEVTTSEIKEAERMGNKQKLESLEKQLVQLGQKLSLLEQSNM